MDKWQFAGKAITVEMLSKGYTLGELLADKYILIDQAIVHPVNYGVWLEFIEGGAMRKVAQDYLWGLRISTIFLGMDHSFNDRGADHHVPILFETMILGNWTTSNDLVGWQHRDAIWEHAELTHRDAVMEVLKAFLIGEMDYSAYVPRLSGCNHEFDSSELSPKWTDTYFKEKEIDQSRQKLEGLKGEFD